MLLFLLLPFLGQFYVSWRTWQLLPTPIWIKVLTVMLMAVALLCLILKFSIPSERLSLGLNQLIYEVGTSWIIIMLYLAMLYLVMDIGRWCHLIPRTFTHSSVAGTAFVITVLLATFVYGNLHYRNKVRQSLELDSKGKVSKPIKVVMMSDLHLGFHNRRAEFARWVDMLNHEHADLILIAGDIIDISVDPLLREDVAQEWKRLEAPVYACMGNHEYFAQEPRARQFITDAGINLLQDSVAIAGDLCIIGRDDLTNRRRMPLDRLTANIDRSKFSILLDHQPYHLEQAQKAHIDFQFSGHTHHGQVWPINWITDAIYEDAWGPHKKGDTQYYVSSGIGIWGGKFRIGTRSEYIVATIH